jgi:quaternary ammonium compound-resistance protein SugE
MSMALLEIASRTIPMGTAYAVWGGIGALGTVLVGIYWFGEPATTIASCSSSRSSPASRG